MRTRDVEPARTAGPSFFVDWLEGKALALEALPAGARNPRDCRAVGEPTQDRPGLLDLLRGYLAPFGPPEAVLRSLRALSDPRATLVVTSQQPGLVGGPLFNLYKAATAIRLAEAIERERGAPCVPLFWNHSEDDDLAEANHVFFPNDHLDVSRFGLPSAPARMLSEWVLDARAGEAFDAELLPFLPGQGREWAVSIARPREGRTLAEEFTRFLLAAFGERGLLVIEPRAIRSRWAATLARLVGDPAALAAAFAEGEGAIRRAGHEPVVASTQAPLFRLEAGRRIRLRLGPEGWRGEDGRDPIPGAGLAAMVRADPDRFGPGVLLRPVLLRAALPVEVSVGGPTEVAYHAQIAPLFRLAELPAPAVHPRAALTLLDPQVAAALDRFGLNPEDALLPEEELLRRLPLPRPQALDRALEEVARTLHDRLFALEGEVSEVDPTLLGPLRRKASRLAEEVRDLRGRIDRAFANRAGASRRLVKRISCFLFPAGKLQERVLGSVWFLAREGASLVETILEAADPFVRAHRFVWLESKSAPHDAPA